MIRKVPALMEFGKKTNKNKKIIKNAYRRTLKEENNKESGRGNNSFIRYKIEKKEVETEKARCKRRQGKSGRCPFNVNANVRVFPDSNHPPSNPCESTLLFSRRGKKKVYILLFISTNRYRSYQLLKQP